MLKKKWANFQRIIELFTQKIVTRLSKIWLWDPGSEIVDPEKTYSGSRGPKGTGSRIRIRNTGKDSWRVADPDSEPDVFGSPGSGFISTRYGSGFGYFYHQAKILKIVRKTLIATVFWLLNDFYLQKLIFYETFPAGYGNYLTWAVRESSIVTAVQPSFKILTRLYKHTNRNRSTNVPLMYRLWRSHWTDKKRRNQPQA